MGVRVFNENSVFDAALLRFIELYSGPYRPVISTSGGKDSTIIMELAVIAAEQTGRLPIDVVTRDEEIMFPGTYEYLERVAQRPEINFHWLVTRHGISNVFNRADPFWFAHDPRISPSDWVREPPDHAIVVDETIIQRMIVPERFPVASGETLIQITGIRAQESRLRSYSVFSAGGYITKPNRWKVRSARPIYDWKDSDVWLAIKEFDWDYNRAYNVLLQSGVSRVGLRIGPPTLNTFGLPLLQVGARAWPRWFDRVAARLPGIRTAAQYGKRVCEANRRLRESWEDTFRRECIENAPPFVRSRAEHVMKIMLRRHESHSTTPFPEVTPCVACLGNIGSWKGMTKALYNGDPLNSRISTSLLPDMEAALVQPWKESDYAAAFYPGGVSYREWKNNALRVR